MLVFYEIVRVFFIVMVIEIDLICFWYFEIIYTFFIIIIYRVFYNVGIMRFRIVYYCWFRGGFCER